MQYCIRSLISITNVQKCCKRAKVCASLLLWHFINARPRGAKRRAQGVYYNMTVWILARKEINFSMAAGLIIQIKICAEYRDMLPRPRLVCQEPGLRPIGRSPGVPDKSSRGLGSMSRYSAQILICFIAYIFLFLLLFPLWVWLGTVQDCHDAQCPLPLAIVIRMRLAIRQSKLPACLAEVQLAF